jgi:hypothetical protein
MLLRLIIRGGFKHRITFAILCHNFHFVHFKKPAKRPMTRCASKSPDTRITKVLFNLIKIGAGASRNKIGGRLHGFAHWANKSQVFTLNALRTQSVMKLGNGNRFQNNSPFD